MLSFTELFGEGQPEKSSTKWLETRNNKGLVVNWLPCCVVKHAEEGRESVVYFTFEGKYYFYCAECYRQNKELFDIGTYLLEVERVNVGV